MTAIMAMTVAATGMVAVMGQVTAITALDIGAGIIIRDIDTNISTIQDTGAGATIRSTDGLMANFMATTITKTIENGTGA